MVATSAGCVVFAENTLLVSAGFRGTIGQHMVECRSDLKPDRITRKVDIGGFLENFDAAIIDHGRDTLETFIREGLCIRDMSPSLNNMNSNGFVFT